MYCTHHVVYPLICMGLWSPVESYLVHSLELAPVWATPNVNRESPVLQVVQGSGLSAYSGAISSC